MGLIKNINLVNHVLYNAGILNVGLCESALGWSLRVKTYLQNKVFLTLLTRTFITYNSSYNNILYDKNIRF